MSKYPLIAIVLFTSSAAIAQAPAQPQTRADVQKQADQNFDKGDANNDGFLSRPEVQNMAVRAAQPLVAKMEQEFSQMDRDKNGQVSLEEFKAAATAKLAGNSAGALDRLDKNKDGKVSPAEFRAPIMALFDRADANKDGKVTPEEARKVSGR